MLTLDIVSYPPNNGEFFKNLVPHTVLFSLRDRAISQIKVDFSNSYGKIQ